MSCGSWCAYYKDRDKSTAMCKYCPDYDKHTTKPNQALGGIDIYKLADGLEIKHPTEPPVALNKDSKLETCPKCGLPTLMYNERDKKLECINTWCPNRKPPSISDYLTKNIR
jgi:hypothetical protein